ncbi:MAG: hypothetical protein LBF27_20010 [Sphingobacterium sp.]|jgi:succinate dehydrogenase hydrophobic anchor subunit|nr:hypothetical protein [Sphingobacterium sp.]
MKVLKKSYYYLLKKSYYYLFYFFYRFWEKASYLKVLSDWKASVCVIALEIWLVLSVYAYYITITKTKMEFTIKMPVVFVPLLIILAINHMAFGHNDVWKDYVKKFDKLPKEQNRKGGWVVFGIVLFVIANLVFSFYLVSRVDWSQY